MLMTICSAFTKDVCHFIDVGQSKFARAERLGLAKKNIIQGDDFFVMVIGRDMAGEKG